MLINNRSKIGAFAKSKCLSGAIIAALAQFTAPVFAQNTDIIRVAIEEDIRGLDPARNKNGLADEVHMQIVEGLVSYGNTLEVGPVLAQSITIEDGGATYIFKLREGVKFHNGEILSAQDVKWSWDYLMQDDSLWRCKSVFDNTIKVSAVEIPNPTTVVYKLAEPSGSFLHNLARPDCAATPVFHKASLNDDGSWNKVIATGPFTMGDREIGQFTEIHSFPDYVSPEGEPNGRLGRKKAMVDTVRFVVVADAAARITGLRSGALDVTQVQNQSIPSLESDPSLKIILSETTSWNSLLLSQTDPVLKDKKLRQAIGVAIDRNAVAEGVSFGYWTGTTTPMPRISGYYSEIENEPLTANADRARALLKESNYNGQTIKIQTNTTYKSMFDQAVAIQSMLQDVGINAEIETLEWGLQLDHYRGASYQAQSFGYSSRFDPLGAWERIIGSEKRKVWKDERAIALLNEGLSATDPEKIREVNTALYDLFMEEVPAVSLFHTTKATGVNARIEGIKPSPFSDRALWNVSIK